MDFARESGITYKQHCAGLQHEHLSWGGLIDNFYEYLILYYLGELMHLYWIIELG